MNRRMLLATLPLALAGCGGGIYLGLGDGYDDTPPSVSVVLPNGPVCAGDVLRIATASVDVLP